MAPGRPVRRRASTAAISARASASSCWRRSGAMGLSDIHRMNGIKNWGAMCINAIAAATFAVSGIVTWPVAATMAVGGLVGGYGGARLALRVGQTWVRRAVVGHRVARVPLAAGEPVTRATGCPGAVSRARRSILKAHDVRCHAAFAVHGACGGPTRRHDGATTRRKDTGQISTAPPLAARRPCGPALQA